MGHKLETWADTLPKVFSTTGIIQWARMAPPSLELNTEAHKLGFCLKLART